MTIRCTNGEFRRYTKTSKSDKRQGSKRANFLQLLNHAVGTAAYMQVPAARDDCGNKSLAEDPEAR
jgi:hypothetical protein